MKHLFFTVVLMAIFVSNKIAAQGGASVTLPKPGNTYGVGLHYEQIDICSATPATLRGNLLLQTKAKVLSNFAGTLNIKIAFASKPGLYVPIDNIEILSGTTVSEIDNEILANLSASKIRLKLDDLATSRGIVLKVFAVIADGEYFGNIKEVNEQDINAC